MVEGTFFGYMPKASGPVAQWLEPTAHNGLVAGSSPAGPTNRAPPSDFSAAFQVPEVVFQSPHPVPARCLPEIDLRRVAQRNPAALFAPEISQQELDSRDQFECSTLSVDI